MALGHGLGHHGAGHGEGTGHGDVARLKDELAGGSYYVRSTSKQILENDGRGVGIIGPRERQQCEDCSDPGHSGFPMDSRLLFSSC